MNRIVRCKHCNKTFIRNKIHIEIVDENICKRCFTDIEMNDIICNCEENYYNNYEAYGNCTIDIYYSYHWRQNHENDN